MLVCLCKGVSDRHVREAISRGASTVEEVGDECGAGTGCGVCHDMIDLMLADGGATPIELARQAACGGCPRRQQPAAPAAPTPISTPNRAA
jgi:bacterioferritin-associated ferredoxin